MDRIPEIAKLFSAAENASQIEKLLRELLTGSEAAKLSLRWDIVKLLFEGKSQRTIAADLGVSLCKITRGARELKKENSALKKVFEEKHSSH